jgi:hypothetical protein
MCQNLKMSDKQKTFLQTTKKITSYDLDFSSYHLLNSFYIPQYYFSTKPLNFKKCPAIFDLKNFTKTNLPYLFKTLFNIASGIF